MTTPSGAKIRVTQESVNAIFEKDGKKYSVPIGVKRGGDYRDSSDEMFFLQDPHDCTSTGQLMCGKQ